MLNKFYMVIGKNITAQCLNTLNEVKSEEDFWFKVNKKSEVMQAKSHSTLTEYVKFVKICLFLFIFIKFFTFQNFVPIEFSKYCKEIFLLNMP